MKKNLKAVLLPAVALLMTLLIRTDAWAAIQTGYVYPELTTSGPVYHTDFMDAPQVYEEVSESTPCIIGAYSKYKRLDDYSICITLTDDSYFATAFYGSADIFATSTPYNISGFRAYEYDGTPLTFNDVKKCVNNRHFGGICWVKGDVTAIIPVTVEVADQELDYRSDASYCLSNAVFKSNGNVINDPELKAYVNVPSREITGDYIEKSISITGAKYRLENNVKVRVKVKSTPASELGLSNCFSYSNSRNYATGSEVCPTVSNGFGFPSKDLSVSKGIDYVVSYENNVFPTTDDNPAYAVLTFSGKVAGVLKFPFTILHGDLSSSDTVTIADWYEGDTPSVPMINSTKYFMEANEPGEITFTYYSGNAENKTLLNGVPTTKGEYYVEANLPQGKLFNGATLSTTFRILERPAAPAPQGNNDNNESSSSQSNASKEAVTPTVPAENIAKPVVNENAPKATTPVAAAPVVTEAPAAKVETAVAELPTEVPVEAKEKLIEKVTETVTKLVEAIAEDASTIENAVSSETLEKVKAAIEDGKEITASVTVNVVEENSIPSEDKEKIDSVISEQSEKNLEVACYLDLSIMLITGDGEELGTYNELTGAVTFTIAAPKDMECPEGKEYVVIRIHNGESTILPVTVNADGTLSFETDLLSTYALAVMDIATKEEVEAPVETSEEVTEETSKEETVEAEIVEEEAPLSGSTFNVKYVILFVAAFAAIGAALYFVISKNNVNKA